MLSIYKVLLLLIFISAIIDCIITFLIRKQNLQVDNHYFKLQNKYGFQIVTVIKVVFILVLSYFLINPPGNAGAVGAIATIYFLIITIYIKDFLKIKWKTGK